MKRKITSVLSAAITVIFAIFVLSACSETEDTDNTAEQIELISSVLQDMQVTDAALDDNIGELNGMVAELETQIVNISAIIDSVIGSTETSVEERLASIQAFLENQIENLKSEISNLTVKDEELESKIATLKNELSNEAADLKIWVNSTFTSKSDWNEFKSEINSSIAALTTKADNLEASVNSIGATLTSLKEQVESNTDRITALEGEIKHLKNCIAGEHEFWDITYSWSNDFSSCTAKKACKHCNYKINETATSSSAEENVYSVSFTNPLFSTQTVKLTDLTTMSEDTYEKSLSLLFSKRPTDVTLTLPKDFKDFGYINDPIKKYEYGKYVNLTLNGVEKIGDKAFYGNEKLTSINLPDVTEIGEKAFYSAYKLTALTAKKVEKIGRAAFSGADLRSVDLPNATEIGGEAFVACSYLSSVSLPKLTKLSDDIFANCQSLKEIELPSVQKIEIYSLRGTALEKITFGTVIEYIGKEAFNLKNGTEGCTLIFAKGQKRFSGTVESNKHQQIDEEVTSSDTVFCGYTFKQITVAE